MKKINTSPGPYEAAVLADSTYGGRRLTTMVCCFPRIVLSEFNTHRVFSRNSASSRAIPVQKQIRSVLEQPFVPLKFGKNKRGMQSSEYLEGDDEVRAVEEWLSARDSAVHHVRTLVDDLNVHKQWANRILEPFLFHTVIVTATEWDNYFNLRASSDAQPEIQKVSVAMKKAYEESTPKVLAQGGWHLPLIFEEDLTEGLMPSQIAKISAARCARVSYLTHDGKRDLSKDLELYNRLVSAGHMSPLEHVAKVDIELPWDSFSGNFKAPWLQYRKMIPGESVFRGDE